MKVRTDSIIADYSEGAKCFITGSTWALDVHHIFNGPKRKWSDENGCIVYLRHDIHMALHQKNRKQMNDLKALAQLKWEELHHDQYEDVRAEFIRQVGKSYV